MSKLLSIKEVCRCMTWSRTTLWSRVRSGSFPKPISIGPGIRKAFLEEEVDEYIAARIAERDEEAA